MPDLTPEQLVDSLGLALDEDGGLTSTTTPLRYAVEEIERQRDAVVDVIQRRQEAAAAEVTAAPEREKQAKNDEWWQYQERLKVFRAYGNGRPPRPPAGVRGASRGR